MTPTPRQREEWERKHKLALEEISEKISELGDCLYLLMKARDEIEAMTFEDSYSSHLAEQGSER